MTVKKTWTTNNLTQVGPVKRDRFPRVNNHNEVTDKRTDAQTLRDRLNQQQVGNFRPKVQQKYLCPRLLAACLDPRTPGGRRRPELYINKEENTVNHKYPTADLTDSKSVFYGTR